MVYRGALYRGLGIPLGLIAGKKVLEVACGTGQNSLLLAAQFPESLTLVEPNPTGMRHIVEQYENLKIPHTKPVLKQQRLEDFNSDMARGETTLVPRMTEVPVRIPLPPPELNGSIYERQSILENKYLKVFDETPNVRSN